MTADHELAERGREIAWSLTSHEANVDIGSFVQRLTAALVQARREGLMRGAEIADEHASIEGIAQNIAAAIRKEAGP